MRKVIITAALLAVLGVPDTARAEVVLNCEMEGGPPSISAIEIKRMAKGD